MEKRKPHYPLEQVKTLLRDNKYAFRGVAVNGYEDMGFDHEEACKVVENLSSMDFYKSMTAHIDHKVWQDVYRPKTSRGDVYLKVTIQEELVIVSFKRR